MFLFALSLMLTMLYYHCWSLLTLISNCISDFVEIKIAVRIGEPMQDLIGARGNCEPVAYFTGALTAQRLLPTNLGLKNIGSEILNAGNAALERATPYAKPVVKVVKVAAVTIAIGYALYGIYKVFQSYQTNPSKCKKCSESSPWERLQLARFYRDEDERRFFIMGLLREIDNA